MFHRRVHHAMPSKKRVGDAHRAKMFQELAAVTTYDQEQSRLLTLPGELRNIIYEFVLAVAPDDKGVVKITKRSPGNKTPTVLIFLLTCRLVRDEAAGLFYHLHHLRLSVHDLILAQKTHFFKTIGSARLRNIKTLSVTFDLFLDAEKVCKQAVHALPGLEALTLVYENTKLATVEAEEKHLLTLRDAVEALGFHRFMEGKKMQLGFLCCASRATKPLLEKYMVALGCDLPAPAKNQTDS